MKTLLKPIVFAAVLGLFSMNSFAALNMYLKIEGGGKTKIVQIKCPDGSCATTVDGLTAGKYSFSLCDAQGRLMKAKEKANQTKCTCSFTYTCTVSSPRDIATGQASGKVAATTTDASSITSPRDQSTGMATGKRMHKPITITAEVSKTGEIVLPGDLDGDGITFQKIEWTWSDGSKSAMDDWSTN